MSILNFDLSTISPDSYDALRNAFKESRNENGDVSLTLTWQGNAPCPLLISKNPPNVPGDFAGFYLSNEGMFVKNYGNKRKNELWHRGSIPGTIFHEWCHRIQDLAASNGIGEWYWDNCHPKQDELYNKWSSHLEGFYAAIEPHEMAAEAFRVLKGWRSNEPWEENKELLADWREFFMGDEIFSLMLDC